MAFRKLLTHFPNTYSQRGLFNLTHSQQSRFLSLHEYQSKKLLSDFGVTVQKGQVASTPEEAYDIAEKLKNEGADELIVKAQIKAGGRGKGVLSSGLRGGVQICSGVCEVLEYSKGMLGHSLVTEQTGVDGYRVDRVLVHEGVCIMEEYYMGIVMDRESQGPAIISSPKGGINIEEVAKSDKEMILVTPIDIEIGITHTQISKIVKHLILYSNFDKNLQNFLHTQISNLYTLFIKCDATLLEINPLALCIKNQQKTLIAIDAKINFDDAAAFRQKNIFQMQDNSTEDPREVAAESAGLNFVALDGNIGCLVNGAGLAMATMDIVKLHGGNPANFLDVGGGASVEQVTEAFKILTGDQNVKAMFVNIFGGIMRCDIIAEGLVFAAQKLKLSVPLVVRLCGNRVEQARNILENSQVQCYVIDDLEEAAKKVCSLGN